MNFIFIAVNYNGFAHTRKYLDSIRSLKRGACDIVETIIVDNHSAQSDVSAIREYLSGSANEKLIALASNVGYFKGLNVGIQACTKNDHSFLIVGNNDLLFDADFLVQLRRLDFEQDVQVIAPNVVTLDGRRQNPHVISGVSRLQKIMNRVYFANYYITQLLRLINKPFKILFAVRHARAKEREYPQMKIKRGIGACYVLLPSFFKVHSRLDDRVFLWGEEALLSNQVESSGGATLYAPSLLVTHCESASVRFIESRQRYDIVRASYKIYKDYL